MCGQRDWVTYLSEAANFFSSSLCFSVVQRHKRNSSATHFFFPYLSYLTSCAQKVCVAPASGWLYGGHPARQLGG